MIRPLAIGLTVSLILWGLLIWWLGWVVTLTIMLIISVAFCLALIVEIWCDTDHID